jgi:NAD(P)-dependent dehydrogenase (short-subunit alcohol dehydrogenase family)
MTTLSDQTTLVTGANRGLGREFVNQFLAWGAAKVYAAARDQRSITMHDPYPQPLQRSFRAGADEVEYAGVGQGGGPRWGWRIYPSVDVRPGGGSHPLVNVDGGGDRCDPKCWRASRR